ncbi:predicted protein, partial [Nematostella vectensis]
MKARSNKQVKGFGGPTSHWLKGNINDITFDGHGLAFHIRCTERFKTAYRVWFGPLRSALVLCHPDTVKPVLSKNAPKERFFYKFLFPFLGDGLGLQEGAKWWNTRKLVTPAFHFDILRRYVPIFQESAKILVEKWSQACGPSGRKVELFQDISLMTLDSVLKCAFSYSSNCQTEGHDKYIKAINGIAKALLDRLLNPFYHFDWLYRLTPARSKFMKYCDLIHQKSDEVIESRRLLQKSPCNGHHKRSYRDFLDILLEAEDINGNGLNNENIRAEVNTFMFAGHDTVASGKFSVDWCLDECHRYSYFNNKFKNVLFLFFSCRDDINNMNYLSMCMKESMRLFSPVPVIGRTLDEEYVIDGKRVPEGTFVLVCIYAVHRNPHVWEKPQMFNPRRFETDTVEGRSAYAFIPFSGGPR